jgi:ribose 5-phosphate isomerase A
MEKMQLKKLIAATAVDTLIKSGMKIGLGTGTTALHAVHRVAELIQNRNLEGLTLVTTSLETRMECLNMGLDVTTIMDPRLADGLDLTIDGADEIDPQYRLIKGHGGALLSEKIIAYASREFAVVADSSKLVDCLGTMRSLPVEVVPEALTTVTRQLASWGAGVTLRQATHFAGPVYTERGNVLLDAKFKSIPDPVGLEKQIAAVPGVVESGLFCRKVNHLFIGHEDGSVEHRRP